MDSFLSLVKPGRLSVRAFLERDRVLNKEDFPTFGRPTRETVNIQSFRVAK